MEISAYQVSNVLRVYKVQLRQSKLSDNDNTHDKRLPDKIDISSEAKKKAVIDKIASNAFDRITLNGTYEEIEKKAFKKLKNECGGLWSVSKEASNQILFKEIDENGEAVHSLSLEDSRFLSHKLKEITKEMVDDNVS